MKENIITGDDLLASGGIDQFPVPVVNPGQVAYKMCEMFLQLGLTHSKKAYPAPEMPNDAMILSRGGR